jgi:hypothetical protein
MAINRETFDSRSKSPKRWNGHNMAYKDLECVHGLLENTIQKFVCRNRTIQKDGKACSQTEISTVFS